MRDLTTPKEVREELNLVEDIAKQASSADEYLEAILRAVNANAELLAKQSVGTEGYKNKPPDDTAGIVIQDGSAGDITDFLYKDDGRTMVSSVEASRNLDSGEVAVYDENQGGLIPATGVGQGDLDFGSVASALVDGSNFTFIDTIFDADGGNVEVAPGETKTVLSTDLNQTLGLMEVGTNDEEYTLYQYQVDGENLLSEPIPKPLGLYNNRYEFPHPIKVTSSFKVVLTRQEDAPSSQEYFSNAVLM